MRPEKIPFFKFITKIVIFGLLMQIFIPLKSLADGGPPQPEYSNFEPVSTTNMVDEFTGAFTYNLPVLSIPGPNGSGYALSLSYHSGHSPNDDASWVGYGWTLNPGAIIRQKKGFPDEYKNTDVIYWNKTRPNITGSKMNTIGLEYWSQSTKTQNYSILAGWGSETNLESAFSILGNFTWGGFYNTYSGFQEITGLGVGSYGLGINANWKNNGEVDFNFNINLNQLIDNINRICSDKYVIESKSFWSQTLKHFLSQNSNIGFSLPYGYDGKLPLATEEFSGDEYLLSYSLRIGGEVYSKIGSSMGMYPVITETMAKSFGCGGSIDNILGNVKIRRQEPKNGGKYVKECFGYMFSGDITNNKQIMDYFEEKMFPFDEDNKYLPIPYSNADLFMVTGEGLTGSFRLYNKSTGHFRPNRTVSELKMSEDEIDVNAAYRNVSPNLEAGIGYGRSWGVSRTIEEEYSDPSTNSDYYFSSYKEDNEPVFFRFTNDMGGDINYYPDYASDKERSLIKAKINRENKDDNEPELSYKTQNLSRIGRVNYIGYNLNKDIKANDNNSPLIYAKNDLAESDVTYPWNSNFNTVNENGLAEFNMTNANGYNYTYGLPVYNRNERDLNYGVTKITNYPDSEENGADEIDDQNYLLYKQITTKGELNSDDYFVVIGHELNEPYANTYLLTSITTPDYIDLTGNGPSADDLGGWTKFNYEQAAGSLQKKDVYVDQWDDIYGYEKNSDPYDSDNDKYPENESPYDLNQQWYKWRIPYNGLKYHRNSQSDQRDDMGSVIMGEKELYYLESIETKTHIAYFVTNKTSISINLNGVSSPIEASTKSGGEFYERKDCYEASHDEYYASGSKEATTAYDASKNQNPNKVRFLERIELYAKDPDYANNKNLTKLLQTVHFNYDYSAWPNQPNSYLSSDGETNVGKLTLRKLWIDYENIYNETISPYIFNYEYDVFGYPAMYDDLDDYGKLLNQTPSYNPLNIDRWGMYQDGMQEVDEELTSFHKNEYNWVTQKPKEDFDPAAWHLKEIVLPSQGRIHIQYEQNEYSYVQDKIATVMAKLHKYDADKHDDVLEVKITDVFDVDIENIDAVGNELENLVREKYIKNNEAIYFKFLFALINHSKSANLESCLSEYVDGYAKVVNVQFVPNGLDSKLNIWFVEGSYPTSVCKEYASTNRNGLYEHGKDCNCDPQNNINVAYEITDDQIKNRLDDYEIYSDDEFCKAVDPEHSYIRLPVPLSIPKKGGGVRVKRLLTLDEFDQDHKGLEAKLYGTEYIYETFGNKIISSTYKKRVTEQIRHSSGVATNEPHLGKEENALISYYIDGSDEDDVTFAGKDKADQIPFGETLLPIPTIVYSDIISRNIYQGKTNPGFAMKKYYTYKDVPSTNGFTCTGKDLKSYEIDDLNVCIYSKSSKEFNASQGYQFELNNINGQLKETVTYGGNYDEDPENWEEGIKTSYEYFGLSNDNGDIVFEPELLPVFNNLTAIDNDEFITYENIGREMEIINDSRTMTNEMFNRHLQGDVEMSLWPFVFIPWVSGGFNYTESSNEVNVHVNNKIISYPVVPKRTITTTPEGIESISENIAFDRYTGYPVITRATDGFDNLVHESVEHDGAYYNYNFLAHNEYPELGQKAQNEKLILRPNASFNFYRRHSKDNPSDETYNDAYYLIVNPPGYIGDVLAPICKGDLLKLTPSDNNQDGYAEYYHVKDVQTSALTLVPLFDYNIPYSNLLVDIEIVRSGYKNQLASSVGHVMTYGTSSTERINNDDNNPLLPLQPPSPTNYFVPASELTSRQYLVNALNHTVIKSTQTTNDPPYDDVTIVDQNYNPLDGISVYVKDIDGNCFELNDQNIDDFLTIDRLYNYPGDAASWMFYLYYNRSDEINNISFESGQMHPFVHDLNACLNKIYSLRLDEVLPEYDWFCYQEGDLTEDSDYRYSTRVIRNQELVEKIDDIIGLTDLLASNYNINGANYQGQYLINYTQPNSTWIITDNFERKAFIAKKYFTFNSTSTSWDSDWWFGIKRKTFWPMSICDCFNNSVYDDDDCKINSGSDACRNFADFDSDVDCIDGGWLYSNPNNSFKSEFVSSAIETNSGNNNLFTQAENYKFTDIAFEFVTDANGKLSIDAKNQVFAYSGGSAVLYDDNLEENLCQQEFSWGYEYWPLDENSLNFDQAPFELDEYGRLVFNPDFGEKQLVTCFNFCSDYELNQEFENVISTSALTLSDEWDYNDWSPTTIYNEDDDYALGKKGIWRKDKNYVYKSAVTPGAYIKGYATGYTNPGDVNIYSGGVYDNIQPNTIFNWKAPDANDFVNENDNKGWINTSTISMYSTNGKPLEEYNILDIPATTCYGYKDELPILIATNAEYGTVAFQSYEDKDALYDDVTDSDNDINSDLLNRIDDYAHSGLYSKLIDDANTKSSLILHNYKLTTTTINSGLLFQFWVKTSNSLDLLNNSMIITDAIALELYNANDQLIISKSNSSGKEISLIAKTGEWSLCSVNINSSDIAGFSDGDLITFKLDNNWGDDIWIDDIRVLPIDAEMQSYVFNGNNLRLMAILDDQHFGTYYQYNAEGKLIRIQKETYKGLKTISEANYNIPKLSRGDDPTDGYSNSIEIDSDNPYNIKNNWKSKKHWYQGNQNNNEHKGDGVKGKFNIFQFELSPDKQQMKFFDNDLDLEQETNKIEKELDSTKQSINPSVDNIIPQQSKLDDTIQNLEDDVNNTKNKESNKIKTKINQETEPLEDKAKEKTKKTK